VRGSLSGGYVRKTGDTMTGALTISANADPVLIIDRPDGAAYKAIEFRSAATERLNAFLAAAEPYLRLRDAADAERLTLDASTGLLGTALIPLSLMRRDQVGTANVGAVTILVGMTTILSLPTSVDVAIGDRIFVIAAYAATKGATLGNIYSRVSKSAGTSAGFFVQSGLYLPDERYVGAGLVARATLCGVWNVTGAGTLTFTFEASSAGSNSTIAIANAELRYWVMRDSA
jgi:hypothetical protein